MVRKKKTQTPKPYPSEPGERGLLLRWWREERPAEGDAGVDESERDEDRPIRRDSGVDRAVANVG